VVIKANIFLLTMLGGGLDDYSISRLYSGLGLFYSCVLKHCLMFPGWRLVWQNLTRGGKNSRACTRQNDVLGEYS